MQRFDCYDTTVHYISCDISEMTLTQQDECHIACKDQSLNDDYRPLINCYGKSCKNAVEPYSCVVQDCSNELNTCLAAPNPACVERDCESPPRNLASEPDSDCPTIASCYSACPAHCNEDCGADETCLPGCIVVCQRTCRGTAQVADQLAFLELGACQIARCAHVSGVDSTTCMWTQCTSQAARCVASGDAICWDTVQCLLAAAQSAPGERESAFFGCIETGSSSGVDAASELLSCAESVDVSGQACGAASPGDKWQCIKDNCVEEAAACPEP
jgi:hypothetical protein